MYKVLIVEDEDIIRKGLVYSVKWEELDAAVVGEARNGVEGAACIAELSPDIVITDINMPIKGGLEMIAETCEAHSYAAIILTGYSDFEYAKTAIHYGVTEYLLKPLKKAELREAILRAEEKVSDLAAAKQHQETEKKIEELSGINVLSVVSTDYDANSVAEQMIRYVEEHYREKILMKDVSETLSYSESLLNVRFKQLTGITFNDYVNRYRIQKAVELMREEKVSVKEAALSCGFSDYKYFNSVFKKYVGFSPKDFVSRI